MTTLYPHKLPKPQRYSCQQKEAAVKHFFEHGQCIARTRRALGYPSKGLLAKWIDELEPGRRKVRARLKGIGAEEKADAVIGLVCRAGSAREIAEALGVERATLYNWKRELLGEDVPCKMDEDKRTPEASIEDLEARKAELERDIERLELRKKILEGTAELLGKGRCADPEMLTNREKTLLVDELRPAHRLNVLLKEVGLPKSSYLYQKKALARPDKYADLRTRIKAIFSDNGGRYGYRRIHALIHAAGKRVSEKVVCRIMKEEGLVARRPRRRKYSSYKGEIGDAPENLVKRDFHAEAPNKLWLTDITEFSIPAGKVYLSPIIDCFDGACVSWTLSQSPNAELVNTMLDGAISTLRNDQHPVVHNDRGCHYRWPGWIERCEHHGLVRSMSKKGCSPDNSAMEGFFGRLKVEMFHGRDWRGWSVEEFMGAVDDYIRWYNERRIKISLGGMSPMQYRASLGLVA